MRAFDGITVAYEHDGEAKFIALIEGIEHFVTGNRNCPGSLNPAFYFDMAWLRDFAVDGGRVGR
jgi:hypothetical protein